MCRYCTAPAGRNVQKVEPFSFDENGNGKEKVCMKELLQCLHQHNGRLVGHGALEAFIREIIDDSVNHVLKHM